MNSLKQQIHEDAREATARQTLKSVNANERPDIKVALILQAIDYWYQRGIEHGRNQQPVLKSLSS